MSANVSLNSGKVEARVSQELRCTSEQLYDAWLDPKQISQWMASSLKSIGLAGDLKRMETDPRVGGRFCFSDMRNGAEAIHVGSYLALERPSLICFTWIAGMNVVDAEMANPSKVTLTIEPAPNGCIATLVHEMDAQWAEYVSRTEASWARMLRAIEALVVA